jgi:hypothetical protein
MAQIRSAEWGAEEYWKTRIERYMRGEHDPQKALKPRMLYVALQNSAVVGLIAGHLTRRYECDGELQWINSNGRRTEHRHSSSAASFISSMVR